MSRESLRKLRRAVTAPVQGLLHRWCGNKDQPPTAFRFERVEPRLLFSGEDYGAAVRPAPETRVSYLDLSIPWWDLSEDVGVDIDWGDNQGVESQTVPLDPGQASFGHVYSDDANYTVSVTFHDPNAGDVGLSPTMAVADIPPTLSIGGGTITSVASSVDYTLKFAASDPSPTDTVTKWVINWGDGSPAQTFASDPLPTEAQHAYSTSGVYHISASAYQDGNNAVSFTTTDFVLDPTFGGKGFVHHQGGPAPEVATAVAVRSGDEIYVVGNRAEGGEGSEGAIPVQLRYSANGVLDTSFDPTTIVDAPANYDLAYNATAMTVGVDQKIYVAGTSFGDGGTQLYVSCHKLDGSLDTTFGEDGFVQVGEQDVNPRAIYVHPDGRVAVVGSAGNSLKFYRFSDTGALQVSKSFVFGDVFVADVMKIDADGRYVIAGRADGKFGVVRLLSDGNEDTSFDTDGEVAIDFSTSTVDIATGLHVYDDGSILLCGSEGSGKIAIARLTEGGALLNDGTFRDGGRFDEPLSTGTEMVMLPSGKFLVAGTKIISGQRHVLVTRFRANGDKDSTFGNSGTITLDPHAIDNVSGMAMLSDGRVVLAGSCDDRLAVASLLPETSLAVASISLTGGGTADVGSEYETGLTVSGATASELSWTIDWGDGTDQNGDPVDVGEELDGHPTEATHTYTLPGIYIVKAWATDGDLIYTTTKSIAVASNPPQTPTDFTAMLNVGDIDLEWEEIDASVTRFDIQMSLDDGVTFTNVASVDGNESSLTLKNLDDKQTYVFRIAAVSPGGTSEFSDVTSPVDVPLATPLSLTATQISADAVTLGFWNGSTAADQFALLRKTGTGPWSNVETIDDHSGPGALTIDNTSLSASTEYVFKIRAIAGNDFVESDEYQVRTEDAQIDLGEENDDIVSAPDGAHYTLVLSVPGMRADTMTWTIDWGDESDLDTVNPGDPLEVTHQYALEDTAHAYAVTVTAVDENETITLNATKSVTGYPAEPDSGEMAENTTNGVTLSRQQKYLRALKAFEWVYNNIKYEPYAGQKKGVAGTVESLAGNDWDQAAVLVEKLAGLATNVRYQFGTVTASYEDVFDFLGVTNHVAAYTVLADAGLHPTDNVSASTIAFDHVWVTADIGKPAGGTAHLKLDPSWKFKDLPENRNPLLNNIATNVPFNASDVNAYLSQSQAELPFELYEDSVSDYLAEHVPGVSLADVPYDGPIIAKHFLALPTQFTGSLQYPTQAASTASVPADKLHRVRLTLTQESPNQGINNVYAPDAVSKELPTGTHGRYVKLKRRSGTMLVIAEVRVWGRDASGNIVNLAQLRYDNTSTSAKFLGASGNVIANDGGRWAIDGVISSGTLQNYAYSPEAAAWQLDLGADYELTAIEVWARNDNQGGAEGASKVLNQCDVLLSTSGSSWTNILPLDQPFVNPLAVLQKDLDVPAVALSALQLRYLLNPVTQQLRAQIAWGDGPNDFVNSTVIVPQGTCVALRVDHQVPGGSFQTGHKYSSTSGTPIVAGLGADQFSDRAVAVRQGKLNEYAVDPKLHTKAATRSRYQEKLLSLAAAAYFNDLQTERRQSGALMQLMWGSNFVESGLMIGDVNPQVPDRKSALWQQIGSPLNATSTVQTDNSGLVAPSPVLISGGVSAGIKDSFSWVTDLNSSALEHATLARITGLDAVSTVTQIQWAHDHGISVVTATSVSKANSYINKKTLRGGFPKLLASEQRRIFDAIAEYGWVEFPVARLTSGTWNGSVFIAKGPDKSLYALNSAAGGSTNGNEGEAASPGLSALNVGIKAGDPVNVLNGNVEHDEQDIAIPNIGIPLNFARHYDSLSTFDRGLGVGWMHTYSDFLEKEVKGSTTTWKWHTSSGKTHVFTEQNGSYINPDGVFGTLTLSGGKFKYTEKGGLLHQFKSVSSSIYVLDRIEDRYANALQLDYDGSNRLTKVYDVHHTERALYFGYKPSSSDNHIATVKDFAPAGVTQRTWSYGYMTKQNPDANNESSTFLVSASSPEETNPASQTIKTSYDYYAGTKIFGLLAIVRNINVKAQTRYSYYANRRGFSTSIESYSSSDKKYHSLGTEYFSYDLNQNRPTTKYIDPRGNVTTYVYDLTAPATDGTQDIEMTRIIQADRSREDRNWSNSLVTDTYDAFGEHEHFTYYAGSGNVNQHTGKDGTLTSYTYDSISNGVATMSVDPPGTPPARTTTWHHVSADHGNVDYMIDAEGNKTTYDYDARGQMTMMTRPRGNDSETDAYTGQFVTTYDHNDAGQVEYEYFKPRSGVTKNIHREYNSRGYLDRITDATGRVTKYTYDILGHALTMTVNPDDPSSPNSAHNEVTRYVYADGRLKSVTDAGGLVTSYLYDPRGSVKQTTYPDGGVVVNEYDEIGNLISTTDQIGIATQYLYDTRNRNTQTLYNDGAFHRVRYDGGGRVVATADPLNDVTDYGRDPATFVSNQYDALDRLTKTIDAGGQVTVNTYLYISSGLQQDSFFYWNDTLRAGGHDWLHTRTFLDKLGRQVERRGTDGVVTTAHYDDNGNVDIATQFDVGTSDPLTAALPTSDSKKRVTTTAYNWSDQPAAITDPEGNTTRMEYDEAGRVISVIDPRYDLNPDHLSWYSTNRAYDGMGRHELETLPDAKQNGQRGWTAYGYDKSGNVNKITQLLSISGSGTQHTAVTDLNVNRKRDIADTVQHVTVNGIATTYTSTVKYDKAGHVIQQTDARGPATNNPDAYTTKYKLDTRGRVNVTTYPNPNGGLVPKSTDVYNAAGNLASSIGTDGIKTTTVYDALRRPTAIVRTNTDGQSQPGTSIQYLHTADGSHPAGQDLVLTTDGEGFKSQTARDNAGHVTEEKAGLSPGQSPTTVLSESFYDNFGQLSQIRTHTDPSNASKVEITNYGYYKTGWLKLERRPDPDTSGGTDYLDTWYTYDKAGNQSGIIEPLANLGSNPSDSTLGDRRDDNLHASSTTYDVLNHVTQQRSADPDSASGGDAIPLTTFGYDLGGRLVTRTDPASNVTSFDYDELGRKTKETTTVYTRMIRPQPNASLEPNQVEVHRSFGYDAVSNLTSITDRNGNVRTFEYNALNQRTDEVWNYMSVGMHFNYDDAGRLTDSSDLFGPSFSYEYDELGRLWHRNRSGDAGVPAVQWTYAYDDADNLTSTTAKQGTTTLFSNTFVPDFRGRTAHLTQTIPGQTSKTVVYDDDLVNRHDIVTLKSGGTTVATSNYDFDYAGRLKKVAHTAGGNSRGLYELTRNANDQITHFEIDGTDRVLTLDANGQTKHSTVTGEDFTYDANGNRTGNDLTTGKDNRLVEDGDYVYKYDKEGNLTFKIDKAAFDIQENTSTPVTANSNSTLYVYDQRNRLTNVSIWTKTNGSIVADEVIYTYDVDDNRTSRTVNYGNPSKTDITESYAHDGRSLALVFDDVSTTAGVSERVMNGPSGEPLAVTTGSTVRWLLADQVGSVRQVIDNSGAVKDEMDYDSFGNVRSDDADEFTRFQYGGGEFEPATKLTHFDHREYEPVTGRFVTQDPIEDGSNFYSYGNNAPVTMSDPSGLSAVRGGGATTGSYAPSPSVHWFSDWSAPSTYNASQPFSLLGQYSITPQTSNYQVTDHFTAMAYAAAGLTDPRISGAANSYDFAALERGRFAYHAMLNDAESSWSSAAVYAEASASMAAAQGQLWANAEAQLAYLPTTGRADMIASAALAKQYVYEATGNREYAESYAASRAAMAANGAAQANLFAGYNPHQEQYTPPAWEQAMYIGAFGEANGRFIHSVVSSEQFMNAMDRARPAMTAVADVASFVPFVNGVAIPVSVTLHAANSYAAGGSLREIAEETATQTAMNVGAWGTSKVIGLAWANYFRNASTEVQGGVYLLRDPITRKVMRTGRTNNFIRREAEHMRNPDLQAYDFEPVYPTDRYFQQRGLEQRLHDRFQPPLNFKQPISPYNPLRPVYMRAANAYFGG